MKTWMGATVALLWGAMLFAAAAPASAAEQDEGGAPPAEAKPDTRQARCRQSRGAGGGGWRSIR